MKYSRILSVFAGALLPLLLPSLLQADTTYRVGPEDVLQVRVARHEELGGEVVVLQDGRVVLPVVGSLSVNGLTVEEIRQRVAQGLRKKLVSPEVSVNVLRPRPQRIFISGAVRLPQALDLKEGWRITEALANAGGLVVRPELARGTLFRLPDKTVTLDLARIYVEQDPTANLRLQPGDVIDIQEQPTVRIYVAGQVMKPGIVDLTRGRGVVEALALAGGTLPTAAPSKAYVVKASGLKIPVNLSSLINHGPDRVAGFRQTVEEAPKALASPSPSEPSIQPGNHAVAGSDALVLEAGDQLIVPENLTKVAVFGLVTRPGSFPMRDGELTTVADAISLAGGFEPRAQKSNVGIIRMVDGKQTVISVDMNRLVKGKETNPPLQDRDVIFVPETGKPDWYKILPGVQALTGIWWYVAGH